MVSEKQPSGIQSGRGGKRPGAGRPKGSPNKASIARQAAIESSGLTPLDYMLTVLRESEDPADRKWAAQNAAPYVHPRLSSVEANVKGVIDLRAKLLEME